MTTQDLIVSTTIQDEPGEKTATPAYFTFPDTQTVAQLITFCQTVQSDLDAIIDGKITRCRAIVEIPLAGGLKSTPATGSDNEETGLLTYSLTSPSSKSFSQDIPAVAQAVLLSTDKNKVDLTNAAVEAWTILMTGGGSPYIGSNNVWSTALNAVKTGLKTFRKHRRQAKRT